MKRSSPRLSRLLLSVAACGALLLTACGHGAQNTAANPAPTTASSGDGADASTDAGGAGGAPPADASLPPGAQPGLDDLNGDSTPDPTCGQQDFGGGLVLRIPCTIPNPNEPDDGVRLVKDSLFRLPSFDADLTGISGSLVTARDAAGKKVVVIVFNSDNLFATGSDQLGESNTLTPVVTLINNRFAGGTIQVRGHTDKTGTASANQALSERRAATVKTFLTGHGVNAGGVSSVGLGSSQPLAEESNPDGSPSLPGRAFNRRVEIAIRLP
ncbi:OmpA family protein [Dactylosporangium sp. CA-092794]|uniref:OmpA family protein n=1 Tax=Dactylosporangium sp. CA-092794 TaxID=3239929 RepID=UPI003D91E189